MKCRRKQAPFSRTRTTLFVTQRCWTFQKCFIIVELKTNKITHQDIGQLDIYVRMVNDLEKWEGDNPTIGILRGTETDRTIARYSVLHENKQLFASKYLPYLPTEEGLIAEIEREKQIIKQLSDKSQT